MNTQQLDPTTIQLPADLTLGPVHLIVADLQRALDWYSGALGMVTMDRDGGSAQLGDGHVAVLVLHEDTLAQPAGHHAGLYHVALLFPSRQELARAALRLAEHRTPIQGASDHRTHEAIYLADVDGNGLELAVDRPRDQWPADLGYSRGPAPLDFADLLTTIDGQAAPTQVAPGLRPGHLHLHVGDIAPALHFYHEVLGFTITANLGSAAFFAAGGYHHHLAVNVWKGLDVPRAPAHAVGLHHWTIVVPSPADVAAVSARVRATGITVDNDDAGISLRDPWGMRVDVHAA